MHAFLAGDADVLVSTTIIESGIDIPQANTLDRRARGRARARAALPDPRPRRPLRRPRVRVPLLPRRVGADARGPSAALDARRPHGARRGVPDRDARPRDPRRGRPARAGAVGPRRRARIRALRRDARRGSRGAHGTDDASPRGRCASTPASTRTFRRRTSPRRRSRSTSTGGSRSWRTRTSCASSSPRPRTGTGPLPEPVENLFAIQEAKLKLARLGADYLVFRGGRATVGPLSLGSAEVRALVGGAPTVIYSTQKREVSLRVESSEGGARAARCYCPRPSGRVIRGLSSVPDRRNFRTQSTTRA